MQIVSIKTESVLEQDFSIHLQNGRNCSLYVLFETDTMVYTNGTYEKATPGTGIFFRKNQTQSYYNCDSVPFNHSYLLFDPENAYEEQILESYSPGTLLQHREPQRVLTVLTLLETAWLGSSSHREELLSRLGDVFFYTVLDDTETPLSADLLPRHREQLRTLRQEIYREPFREWTVDALCQRLCYSRYYVQHLYKEMFGVSCGQDVIQARVKLAQTLLLTTDRRVADVAEACGYKNTEHFIRQFSRETGLSPAAYRRQYL